MLDMPEMIGNLLKGTSLRNKATYVCPACGTEYDVEAVRRITERGEWPVCRDCGVDLVMEDGD